MQSRWIKLYIGCSLNEAAATLKREENMDTKRIGKRIVQFKDGSRRELEILIPFTWASLEDMVLNSDPSNLKFDGDVIVTNLPDQAESTTLTLFIFFPDKSVEPVNISESEARSKGLAWDTDNISRVINLETNEQKVYRIVPDTVS
jgi:hypothetical protein